jgi:2'-5' RNA ligase
MATFPEIFFLAKVTCIEINYNYLGMNRSSEHNMYFLAILCPPQVDDKVLSFKHWVKEQFASVVALKSPAHITLIPPFWLEETREAELLQTLQSFTSDMEELEIQLEVFLHFGKKVLFVQVKENPSLQELQSQTENYFLQSFGGSIKKDNRPFHPHITIANRDIKPGDFGKAWQYFSKKIFKETFRTKTISLLKLISTKWIVIGEKNW